MKKNYFKILLLVSLCCCMTFVLTACSPSNYGYSHTDSTVKTPKGTTVNTGKYEELTTSDYNHLNNLVASNFPNVNTSSKKLREPTNKYNCHSYAFFSTSTSNVHWIGHDCSSDAGEDSNGLSLEVKKYWNDGSYVYLTNNNGSSNSIPSTSTVPIGSKVSYAKGDHSAIRTSSTEFTSKWGAAGLYIHAPSYCDYDPSSLNYYKYYK